MYSVPLIVLPEKLIVYGPKGETEIDNPMYKYATPVKMGDYGIQPVPADWPYNTGSPVPVITLIFQAVVLLIIPRVQV